MRSRGNGETGTKEGGQELRSPRGRKGYLKDGGAVQKHKAKRSGWGPYVRKWTSWEVTNDIPLNREKRAGEVLVLGQFVQSERSLIKTLEKKRGGKGLFFRCVSNICHEIM